MQTQTKQQYTIQDALHPFAEVFASASPYCLEQLYHYGSFETQQELQKAADELKQSLNIPADINADDLLIKVLLLQISKSAAARHINVLKSVKAIEDICGELALDESYKNLLLENYASLGSQTLFEEECDLLTDIPSPDGTPAKADYSKIIDTLLDKAQNTKNRCGELVRENSDYISSLADDKLISRGLCLDLLSVYRQSGVSNFEEQYEKLLQLLSPHNPDGVKLNHMLAAKIMLWQISQEEAQTATQLSKALGYPILGEDILTLTLKYTGLKSIEEVAHTFKTLLQRLPYLDNPEENLGLCVNVMLDASLEALNDAQKLAQEKRNKILYMRQLSLIKHFAGREDELTQQFYPDSTVEDISALFDQILHSLPHNKEAGENADIAIKILLKKLPLKDGLLQASFRKENKLERTADTLEREAIGLYMGTKSKEEVLSFIRQRLGAYTFWKQDAAKHCYALSILVEELNGKISTPCAALSLDLLQAGYPEESADAICKAIKNPVSIGEVITGYERFYQSSKDHKDAARRVINMLQQ